MKKSTTGLGLWVVLLVMMAAAIDASNPQVRIFIFLSYFGGNSLSSVREFVDRFEKGFWKKRNGKLLSPFLNSARFIADRFSRGKRI